MWGHRAGPDWRCGASPPSRQPSAWAGATMPPEGGVARSPLPELPPGVEGEAPRSPDLAGGTKPLPDSLPLLGMESPPQLLLSRRRRPWATGLGCSVTLPDPEHQQLSCVSSAPTSQTEKSRLREGKASSRPCSVALSSAVPCQGPRPALGRLGWPQLRRGLHLPGAPPARRGRCQLPEAAPGPWA